MIENCSGGGGRYDLAMMAISTQIWTSDNTMATERVKIQYGPVTFQTRGRMTADWLGWTINIRLHWAECSDMN